ncbi:hypothetical protein AB0K09_03375 [Streptomyces sp. NPDC049577]|uniref:hypothetical protein n=1 Tax=Streptomyces sp. NPDC049577 TaxID=3155153 RepID=UPI00343560D0
MTTAADAPSVPAQSAPTDPPQGRIAEVAAGVTAALVAGWDAIRARHPQVPDAVISMATGGRESRTKSAHFAPHRWRIREGSALHHEVFVTAESLEDGAREVFGALLHEAAHALNNARGKRDCSASQYHNKTFRDAAAELGLIQKADVGDYFKKKYGFAGTAPTDETAAAYDQQIAALDEAIRATRVRPAQRTRAVVGGAGGTASTAELDDDASGDEPEGADGPPVKEDRNYAKATCQCEPPTVIRVSPRTLAKRTILCGECVSAFEAE